MWVNIQFIFLTERHIAYSYALLTAAERNMNSFVPEILNPHSRVWKVLIEIYE